MPWIEGSQKRMRLILSGKDPMFLNDDDDDADADADADA